MIPVWKMAQILLRVQTSIRAELGPASAIFPSTPAMAERAIRVEPPWTRKPRGQPRKERIRVREICQRQLLSDVMGTGSMQEGEIRMARAPYRCSTCHGVGHNAAKCRNPHS